MATALTFGQFAGMLRSMSAAASPGAMRVPLKALEVLAVADVRKHFDRGEGPSGKWKPLKHKRVSGGDKPLLDTATLRNACIAKADDSGLTLSCNARGAALHQFGGIVKPVRAKALAIPLTVEAKRAGSPRRFRGKLHREGPRDQPTGVLVETKGEKRIAHYALVKSVKVPARPFLWLSDGFYEQAAKILADWKIKQLVVRA